MNRQQQQQPLSRSATVKCAALAVALVIALIAIIAIWPRGTDLARARSMCAHRARVPASSLTSVDFTQPAAGSLVYLTAISYGERLSCEVAFGPHGRASVAYETVGP